MYLKIFGATLLALVAASTSAAAAPQASTTLSSSQFIPNSGDCNGNGIADRSEVAQANRDDDGDGVCNGVDYCRFEPGEGCTMQAITVPAKAEDPAAPHVTYSGAVTTLKGIARYGGNQFRWDFGDGTAGTPWTAISYPYNLGVNHTYLGSVGDTFTATLSLRNSAAPDTVATASYPIVIKDGGSSLASLTREQTDVRAQMAIEQALWYLHITMTRGTYADGTPGYAQPYAMNSATNPLLDACLVTTAFATHGHVAARPWTVTIDENQVGVDLIPYRYDPYVETARRLLNYVTVNAVAPAIQSQLSGGVSNNPDHNGNGVGVAIGGNLILPNGVCAMAFGESASPDWFAGTGPANVYGRAHTDIAQDITEWLAFAQNGSGNNSRGGWGYIANSGGSNNEVTRWAVMGLVSQEARMGAFTPRFVRTELPFWLNYAHHRGNDYWNGSTGYESTYLPHRTVAFTAGMVLGYSFMGASSSHPYVNAANGFTVRAWTENASVYRTNLGDSNTMFSVARAFRSFQPAITLISDFDYLTGWPIPSSAFHWYYGPVNAPQQGYAGNLIGRQNMIGMFTDTPSFDENGFSTPGLTALGAMVLAPQGAPATATPSASSLDFGSVDLGSTSSRSVTLTNDGDYDFPVGAISATGPFVVTSACGGTIPPAAPGVSNSCTIYLTFEPATGGAATGVLTVASPSGPPTTIPLSGVGVVPKLTPAITWQPASITYGTGLDVQQLNASTDVAGTFSYSPAAGTVLDAGMAQELTVTFTPADPDLYESVTTTTLIDVAPASPVMTLTAAGAEYDGQPHSASATAVGVNGETLGPITITYDGQSDLPVSAGTYTVVASIAADGNYTSASANASLVITKATPVITWPTPSALIYGAALDGTSLNATTNVPGTFTYTPAASTVLGAGLGRVLSVTFAPADTNYAEVTTTTTVDVMRATPTVSVIGGTYLYDGQPHPAVASATGVNGELPGVVSLTYNGVAAAPVAPGTYTVIASLAASANYESASATTTIIIEPPPNTAPVCSAVTASTRTVWPANGRWIDVSISGATDVEGGALQYRIASIFQDEATDSTGDRNTAIDGRGVGTSTASVRAERQGNGNGRVYHITFMVTDEGGLSCTGTVTVGVPHNQKAPAVDGGPLFDSTIATGGRGRL